MINGKTKSGFEFSVDERKLNSKRFAMILAKLTKYSQAGGESGMLANAAENEMEEFLLGPEQQEALVAHCDEKAGGYASIEDVTAEVSEIIAACEQKSVAVKNS